MAGEHLTPVNADIHTVDLDTLFYVRESMVGAGVVNRGHYDRAISLVDEIIRLRSERRPQPHELWKQAEGDRERYIDLMIQHGHLVRRQNRSENATDLASAAPPSRDVAAHDHDHADCKSPGSGPHRHA